MKNYHQHITKLLSLQPNKSLSSALFQAIQETPAIKEFASFD
jgi:hypothetical protein